MAENYRLNNEFDYEVDYELIDETAAYLFNRGENFYAYKSLGAHHVAVNGESGWGFVVFAPAARSVRLVGDFNGWQGDEMYRLFGGFWQLFVPNISAGVLYKYDIETQSGEHILKADPFAFAAELRPKTALLTADVGTYCWQDGKWLEGRRRISHFDRPMNIYELHLGSWRRNSEGGFLTYAELAKLLPTYLCEMGYNYVELLPLTEHPLDGSWGYQVTGYFAPTARFGRPDDLKLLIDSLHQVGIGVILDWVPGHFCRDSHGLGRFDGTPLFEDGEHSQWGTYRFNFARPEVQSFLISNAIFWLEEYHADGIRVDGVTSMLYLNFGMTEDGQKRYADDGTEECKAAIAFLQRLNSVIGERYPDVFTVAEESTAWSLVTYPPEVGGLGFHYKWDMGWMNDTLRYMSTDFDDRRHNHRLLTFSMMYAFNENFILPLSHDEVVHGKKSLIGRMPGDYWRQFAGLRLLALYQMTHSGGKLNFMGSEFGQFIEWRDSESLEWFLTEYPAHAAHLHYISRLNRLYLSTPALWQQSYRAEGFAWQDADNAAQSILIFRRQGLSPDDFAVVILNFGVTAYDDYDVGVPTDGEYREIFNSDSREFGGTGRLNTGGLRAEQVACGKLWHGERYKLKISVPSLGGVIIEPVREYT